ncbi:protocadherin Fat 4 [Octopus bimaculoides]|uniref:Cadherin domain-containing protein n=1 Tax=Octopus bimaculoides TaxID=37653 RepID=A0A0L8HA45_OCTBM|nr:protocadherin Fat 4 [Octopus bimaculoides]|eukprot:XP_014774135.1 PREDICTED: protocadherin Fat 4-like [Octopus bimaculoides]
MAHESLALVIMLMISVLNPVVKSQAPKPSRIPVILAPDPFKFNVSEYQYRAYKVGIFDATRSYFVLPCFSIKTPTDMFRIPACTFEDNDSVYLVNKLDYEKKKKYVLEIVAADFFNSSLATNKNLTINVLNENDERPRFENTDLQFGRIKENINVTDRLPTLISVIDVDDEANSKNLTVTCDTSFRPSCDYFTVIQSNKPNKKKWEGYLYLRKRISLQEYRIKLTAFDGKYSTSVVFTILVEDINNHPPKFNDVASLIAISEETAVGSDISPIIVVEDEDVNTGYLEVKCNSLKENTLDPCAVFQIRKMSTSTNNKWFGLIALKKKLDYEISPRKFVFQLLASDGKNKNKYNITILLEDSNDEPPSFVPSNEWSIKENATPGTFLKGDLVVSDLDETPTFSNITLTCDSSNGEEYAIACSTFIFSAPIRRNKTKSWRTELVLAKSLNYEKRQIYTIRFKATDGKSNSFLERKIYVVDVNDNPPFFNVSQTNTTLPMSTPVKTIVKPLIVALDVDKSNKILTVSCESEAMNQSSANSGCEIFGVKTIKANSSYWVGQLELLKPLIYDELQSTYYVNLTAFDGDFTSNPTTVAVTVEPIPTHLSYLPKPKLNQNVTVKCDFAFSGDFNETTIEILRANISVLTYSPETKTHKLSINNEATKLKEIKSSQAGHHGYISFKINLKSCHENNITCQAKDVKGKLYSVSHDLLTHNFIPSVKINRGTCNKLKRGSARLVCTGYSQQMTTILKWYLTTDDGVYKETNGVKTIDFPPKYDYTKCVYVQQSTIVLDYKDKRRNAKCVMVSEVDNRKVELVADVFSVGYEGELMR